MLQEFVNDQIESHQLEIASILESSVGLYKYAYFAPNNEAFELIKDKDLVSLDQWNTIFKRHLSKLYYYLIKVLTSQSASNVLHLSSYH